MKRRAFTLFTAVLAIAALLALVGCGETRQEGGGSGNVTINVESVVFTASADVMTLTDTTSLKNYMDVLAGNGELTFGGSETEHGFYIQSVCGRQAEGNTFWAVYTDLVTLEGDETVYSNEEWGTYEYNGKTLYSAAYGVSLLPCVAGYTYALVFSSY